MANYQTRIGDIGIGICPVPIPHPYITVFVTGEDMITDTGLPCCTLGSLGITNEGHITVALTASTTVTLNGKGTHRIGDMGMCHGLYIAVTGDYTALEGE